MRKRDYNKNFYKGVKSTNKFIRDNCSEDPSKAFDVLGTVGKIIGMIFKYLIAKPIHFIVFGIVGLFYKKDRDHPAIGSIIYTVVFLMAMSLLASVMTILLGN